jgi:hypothetical protein
MEKDQKLTTNEEKLVAFVTGHTEAWRRWRDTEYTPKWEEYERLWRGIFNETDKTRASERSKVITPILQDAIESYQAEIEEATFGRSCFFDIVDNDTDEETQDTAKVRKALTEDFHRDKVAQAMSEVITLGAVYGTGIGELVLSEKVVRKPATKQLTNQLQAVGVSESDRIAVTLIPVHPKNFLIDPNATDIEGALGVAVEEQVSLHSVVQAQEDGTYRDVKITSTSPDPDLNPSQDIEEFEHGKVTVLRYYGFVPKGLLENLDSETDALAEELSQEGSESYGEDYEDLVEAIVVIGNNGVLLKAEPNPYSMQDRPIVYFPCEKIPKRFFGRGIAEKGYNMQKAIDAQIRSHLDSLALTAAPMMGMDATRMPRGAKFEVHPGKTILTNGAPGEVLQPFMFGQTSPVMAETAMMFERMLQKGTGTLDASGMASSAAGGDARTGAVAMSLGGIIKKNRKSLQAFQSFFLVPMVQKAAWRYMQFAPDRYPSQDYNFLPMSTLGITAREYEQQQLLGMMSTLGGDSPLVPMLLEGIVENSSLSNREELVENLKKMSQPDPEQQKMQQMQQQMQMELAQAQLATAKAQAQKEQANAQKLMMEALQIQAEIEQMPKELEIKAIAALARNSETSAEFDQKLKLAEAFQKERELDIREKDVDSNERIAQMQMRMSAQNRKTAGE